MDIHELSETIRGSVWLSSKIANPSYKLLSSDHDEFLAWRTKSCECGQSLVLLLTLLSVLEERPINTDVFLTKLFGQNNVQDQVRNVSNEGRVVALGLDIGLTISYSEFNSKECMHIHTL